MKFYLGTHRANWLEQVNVPLFVSHRQLAERKRLPIALTGWALDSGAFSELLLHGEWRTGRDSYVRAVRRYKRHIGHLEWVAPQDWMCEPFMLNRTGRTVDDHQHRTVDNYALLRSEAPDLPFIPVLQGWTIDDYLRCVDLYGEWGIDLHAAPLVGLGSVCRRQDSAEIEDLVRTLAETGLSLHGFGVKTEGAARYSGWLTSADSMAWSYAARYSPPLPGCPHKGCANCPLFALRWRERVLWMIRHQQERLDFGGVA